MNLSSVSLVSNKLAGRVSRVGRTVGGGWKFAIEHIGRDDIAALTPEAAQAYRLALQRCENLRILHDSDTSAIMLSPKIMTLGDT